MHVAYKKGFCCLVPSLCWHRLKRHSVSRCPRDDLGRFRLPHDVPQALRPERDRRDLPRRRCARPGSSNLQRRDGHHSDGRQGLSLVGKVSVFDFMPLTSFLAERCVRFALPPLTRTSSADIRVVDKNYYV